jgi:hypothetical protein
MRLHLVLVVLFVACGPTPQMKPQPVSFASQIRPIFNAKCIACHYPGNINKLDLVNPFSETEGLIRTGTFAPRSRNAQLVVPGKPEESQLMLKIDPSVTLDLSNEGKPMPFVIPDVTDAELQNIRTWITSGAADDTFYRSNVAPIFGNAANLGRAIGKCSYCHTATSLYPPDVVDAFSARGMVNVNSGFGGKRVLPGNPDDSVLVKKLAATVPAPLGQKMPLNYSPLTPDEVELVRTWIAEGALNN